MVQFRPQTREIIAKIVYYGPPLGGKTTNLRALYDGYPPATRGELIVVPAGGDRTIFFDFLPVDAGTLRGMRMRVQLYTVPGQVHYNATRQVVLRGVDAVVFVADSQRELLRADRESWENLKENLALQGLTLADVPHVLQYNKRDLADVLSVDDLDQLLNEFNAPFFEAVSTTGIGVEETLQAVVKLVARSLRDRFKVLTDDGGKLAELLHPPAAPVVPPAAAATDLVFAPPVRAFGVAPLDLSPAPPASAGSMTTPPESDERPAAQVFQFATPAPPAQDDAAAMLFLPQARPPVAGEPVPDVGTPAVAERVEAEPEFAASPRDLEPPPAASAPAPPLSDPFDEPMAAGGIAGDDVFELPRPAVTVAVEAAADNASPVIAPEPDFVVGLSGGEEVPPAVSEFRGAAGEAMVQRIVPRLLAQVGEVRELELEVPVPAVWTGGKRLTLQFRLTLIPEEDTHVD